MVLSNAIRLATQTYSSQLETRSSILATRNSKLLARFANIGLHFK